MRSILLGSGLSMLLASPLMAAQVYTWVDAQGQTHFDAQPPTGQSATVIDTGKPPAPAAAAIVKPASPLQGQVRQREIEAKVKAQVAEEDEKVQRYCDDMRTSVAQLQNNPRVKEDVGGTLRPLSEEERQARIAEQQKLIEENCQ
jgi:hypothetical protein